MLKAKFFLLLLLLSAASPGADHTGWSTYGGGPDNTHYSALAQINRGNVSRLQVAWRFDTHDEFPDSEIECNPIVVDGTLFATSPKLRVIALDAATGKLKWSFDPNKVNPAVGKMRNRGVAYWSDPSGKDKRIFFASKEYLYALDATSGKLLNQFGDNGRIDLSRDLGRDNSQLFITATSPPILYRDFLIVSTGISETLPALPGDIRAYDARTGKLRWSFHTIPHPGELGYDTWPKDAWKYIGGANNWAGMSLDVKRGIVFVPTGSATFDFYGANRLGDNLFANSLIALDAATGKRIWHFQTVRHDLWDRDLPAPPALVTIVRNGRRIDAAAQVTKSGYVFLF
ncbi:MAG TPA: PQQ-binding-like beta-propeller repeat protein, partial [Bryobacteraceae bacterium]